MNKFMKFLLKRRASYLDILALAIVLPSVIVNSVWWFLLLIPAGIIIASLEVMYDIK